MTLQAVSMKLVSLVPYWVKLFFKNSTLLAPAIRKFLNIYLALPSESSIVTINSGGLKGYKMALNLQVEKSYWFGVWETKLQRLFHETVKEGMVVYDVGAHIGFFSLLFSKYCSAKGRVFSFEPDGDIFLRLTQNIRLNNAENITAVNVAIADKNGVAFFDKSDIDSMGKLIPKEETGSKKVIEVATQTLDSFVYAEKHPLPSLVKIDVEGAEGKVLAGAERILKEARPLVFCEVHNYQVAQEVSRILARNNYALFNIDRDFARIEDFTGYYGICHVLAKPIETIQ